jgi:hypothetical protein
MVKAQTLLPIVFLLSHSNTKLRTSFGNMAENTKSNHVLLPGLLRVLNELLLDIVPALNIVDLRHLGRVSRKLYYFIRDYTSQYHYNADIFRLPSTLLQRVAFHIGNQKDISHFAQASQHFYPLVTKHIAHHNVRSGESNLLNYAAKRNLEVIAQNLLRLGENVETEHSFEKASMVLAYCFAGMKLTPLAIAAH